MRSNKMVEKGIAEEFSHEPKEHAPPPVTPRRRERRKTLKTTTGMKKKKEEGDRESEEGTACGGGHSTGPVIVETSSLKVRGTRKEKSSPAPSNVDVRTAVDKGWD